jgi:hypothetical protein
LDRSLWMGAITVDMKRREFILLFGGAGEVRPVNL